jgi:hypothetical protein
MRWCAVLCVLLLVCGCASHHSELADVRASLVNGDVDAAVAEFEEKDPKDTDLLYLLERGYIMHLAGRWEESNAAFEVAENRADDLFTKSISRAAISIVSSDLALPYRSVPHELQFVQYYRSLNYIALGHPQEALVEARKSSAYLAEYAKLTEGQELFRQDAFLQYFTGLLYESEREVNDAIVSFRDAAHRYDEYAVAYGWSEPPWLDADYFAAAQHLGLQWEADSLLAADSTVVQRAIEGDDHNLVVFFETGFVPFRESVNITLPVFKTESAATGEEAEFEEAKYYVDQYSGDIYAYEKGKVKLDKVVSFAFPALVEIPREIQYCELELESGETTEAVLVLDLAAIAEADFQRRIPGIMLKTVARALAKDAVQEGVKDADEGLGWLVNIVNVATERADTRGWILLPGQFHMLKTTVQPGEQVLTARFYDALGVVIDQWQRPVVVPDRGAAFVSFRSFQ